MKNYTTYITLLLVILSAYNLTACTSNNSMNQPYGKLIPIENHEIHTEFIGQGKIMVLFFSDIDMYSAHIQWNYIQESLSESFRTLSFDRPGYYWSDYGERPRTGEKISIELEMLLEQEGWKGPYIIVGHGMGAVYGRIFAGRNIEDIYGMIWLDPIHPEAFLQMADAGLVKPIPDKKLRPMIRIINSLSLDEQNLEQYGIDDILFNTAVSFYNKNSLTWFDESAVSEETMEQASGFQNFSNIPLCILTSDKHSQNSDITKLWVQLQTELLSLSSNSSQLILKDAGHYIHLEIPQLLIDEIINICK